MRHETFHYPTVQALKEEIDKYLETLFSGKIDDANGDVLDNIIYDSTRLALKDVDIQKVQHDDTIRNFIIQAEGARNAFEAHKNEVTDALLEVQERLNAIKIRMLNDEFGGR